MGLSLSNKNGIESNIFNSLFEGLVPNVMWGRVRCSIIIGVMPKDYWASIHKANNDGVGYYMGCQTTVCYNIDKYKGELIISIQHTHKCVDYDSYEA